MLVFSCRLSRYVKQGGRAPLTKPSQATLYVVPLLLLVRPVSLMSDLSAKELLTLHLKLHVLSRAQVAALQLNAGSVSQADLEAAQAETATTQANAEEAVKQAQVSKQLLLR